MAKVVPMASTGNDWRKTGGNNYIHNNEAIDENLSESDDESSSAIDYSNPNEDAQEKIRRRFEQEIINDRLNHDSFGDDDVDSHYMLGLLRYCWNDCINVERAKECIRWILDSAAIEIRLSFEDISLLLTLFVLFGEHIELAVAPAKYDYGVKVTITVCFAFFLFELVLNSWAKSEIRSFEEISFDIRNDIDNRRIPVPKVVYEGGYLLSFFWWLDLLIIFAMVPDIPALSTALGLTQKYFGNFSQLGRIVRLIRLFRIVRAYQQMHERSKRRKEEEELVQLVSQGIIGLEDEIKRVHLSSVAKSRLGTQLNESTTKRLIALILILLLVIPALVYNPQNGSYAYGAQFLQDANLESNMPVEVKTEFVSILMNAHNAYEGDLLSLTINPLFNGTYYQNDDMLPNVRSAYLVVNTLFEENRNGTFFTQLQFSQSGLFLENSVYTIILTVLVGFILLLGNIVLGNDSQQLVLKPIERMMKMVQEVARDPLCNFKFNREEGEGYGSYETNLLEESFVKIAGLLKVGFGEAGAGIIKSNLRYEEEGIGSSIINPLLPGVRVYCIVGFCDIHEFEFVTQHLERGVLTFVNTIAAIVHESVHHWEGSCNKNLGNAFVIIWRIGDEASLVSTLTRSQITMSSNMARRRSEETDSGLNEDDTKNNRPSVTSSSGRQRRMSTTEIVATTTASWLEKKLKYQHIDLKRLPGVDNLAAKALIAYLKIIAEINRNSQVLDYRNDYRLNNDGHSKFKVSMGFGLHAGWAIEGAVGSLQKVDATYLSPHVNMAARLETSSRQYGVPILTSHMFYELLSPHIQNYMRKVDVVTVKGSEMPIAIYTYDANEDEEFRRKETLLALQSRALPLKAISRLGMMSHPSTLNGESQPNNAKDLRSSKKRTPSTKRLSQSEFDNQDEPEEVFDKDTDLVTLRKHVTEEFKQLFAEGVSCYINGDWLTAKSHLTECNEMMKSMLPASEGDGPSLTLLKYMEQHHFTKPLDWRGFRPLTSK